jgi:hypothetical protein
MHPIFQLRFFLIATPTDSSCIEVESSNEKIERGYRPSCKNMNHYRSPADDDRA